VAKMMLKPEDVGSYGSCSQVLPKLSTNDYFHYSRCIRARQMVAVLSCNRLYSSHMSKLLMSSNLQVPRLKAVTASQVEYMLWIITNEKVRPQTFRMKPKSTLSWQTCHSLETTQQTNAWKVTGGDEGSVASGK
jgi:hypothetical protein